MPLKNRMCRNCLKQIKQNADSRTRYCSLSCSKKGVLNPHWREKPGLAALHNWVKRRLKRPDVCSSCSKNKAHDLANISQEYKRNLTDWEWLCRKCHMTKDGRLDQFGKLTASRNLHQKGDNHPCVKITFAEVQEMRASGLHKTILAKKYGVAVGTVEAILNMRNRICF